MNIQPLGPQGCMQRMQEIQSQLDAVFGSALESAIQGQIGSATMSAKMGRLSGELGGLSGKIGDLDGNKPLNPFGGGMNVAGASSTEIKRLISEAAREAGIDETLFDSLVSAESAYNPRATSSAGAQGLTQLMPGTAKELGVDDPFDPAQNLRGGAQYLKKMLTKFGDVRLALAAYNAGPGNVQKAGGIPNIPETQNYVNKIMSLYHARRPK